MPEFTRGELIAFNEDLGRYMAAEVAADRRAERIEAMVEDSMRAGQEYYPWTRANVLEAIENAPENNQIVMFACLSSAITLGLDNDHSNHLALTAIKKLVEEYWQDFAKTMAEREID